MNKSNLIKIGIGISLGILGGFLYWRFAGCSSGSCPITSHWYTSAIVGGIFGYLISDSFTKKQKDGSDIK